MLTLPLPLDAELERRLEDYVAEHGMSTIDVVSEALRRFLEDAEDAALAESALREMRSSKPLAQLRRELGLDG
ncbi:MAG: CopG family transcriptional regulator [Pseudomonadota bacterium]